MVKNDKSNTTEYFQCVEMLRPIQQPKQFVLLLVTEFTGDDLTGFTVFKINMVATKF
uniref:Uncharacterized protein n=1 Tax=Tetranychus urticae TaxID=32264 RepID=T1KAX2_TETUR